MGCLQLAKSALSLEVECGELGARVLTALRAERWRTAAEHALRSPSKTTGPQSIPRHPIKLNSPATTRRSGLRSYMAKFSMHNTQLSPDTNVCKGGVAECSTRHNPEVVVNPTLVWSGSNGID